ncbi:MAG TPA: hypothetical protein V6C97_19760 [Oculatellaceae cyanobacterium]
MSVGKLSPRQWISFLTLFAGVLITLVWTMAILQRPLSVNFVSAAYLQYAQLVHSGSTLYLDIYDINLPLITYLHEAAVLLSDKLNLHVVVAFKLFLGVLSLISFLLCAAVLRRQLSSPQWTYAVVLLICSSLMGFAVGDLFGHSEHLFVLMFLPFFLLRWQRWSEMRQHNAMLGIVCGVLAAVGLFTKIYFLLIPIITELYWFNRSKRFRGFLTSEMIACKIVYVLCALQILLLPSPARDVYFKNILPVAIQGYAAFNQGLLRAVSMQDYPLMIVMTLIFSACVFFLRRTFDLLVPLALWMLAAYLAFVLQMKCWTYQTLPLLAGLVLTGAMIGVAQGKELLRAILSRTRYKYILEQTLGDVDEKSALGLLICSCSVALFFGVKFVPQAAYALTICQRQPAENRCASLKSEMEKLADEHEEAALLAEYSAPGDKVLFLNTALYPAYPAMTLMNRLPGSKYQHQQVIAFLEYLKRNTTDAGKLAKLQEQENAVFQEILQDVQTNKPRMILIKQHQYPGCPEDFSLTSCMETGDYLNQILKGYKSVRLTANLDTFVREE